MAHVENRLLFHVTISKPYKIAFAPGQTVRIGDDYNPFFRFYEGAREYPVNNNGAVMNVKAVAWLRQVRDRLITTDPQMLANIATEVAMHYVMLSRELIMEELRRDEFDSQPPSRQRCLYVCETLAEAQYWRGRLGENGSICELSCNGKVHRSDARLLLGDSEPLSVTKDRGRAYWRGEASNQPEWETLFEGDATVIGFVV